METPGRDALITTKLGVQARGGRTVDRERLRARLDTATEARLVLVSAPAGFGKSTLLADWLGRADVRGAWLSLDARDNDIVRFARYLAAATTRLAGGTGDATGVRRPVLRSRARPGRHPRPPRRGRKAAAVLVLDDYHVIEEPAIHRLVASLVERLPAGGPARDRDARRSAAPARAPARPRRAPRGPRRGPPLHRRRGRPSSLRSAGVELASPEVEELTERTEGWAAALRLAAVSLRGRPDQAELVRRFGASHRYVLDYVVEEVLAGLPREDPGVPAAHLDPRPPVRPAVRGRRRRSRRPGAARGAGAREPPDHPARRRAALVPLPRAVRRDPPGPAADAPSRRGRRAAREGVGVARGARG